MMRSGKRSGGFLVPQGPMPMQASSSPGVGRIAYNAHGPPCDASGARVSLLARRYCGNDAPPVIGRFAGPKRLATVLPAGGLDLNSSFVRLLKDA
jgi:hypothetical protein